MEIITYILITFASTADMPPVPTVIAEYNSIAKCQEQRSIAIKETAYRWKFVCLEKGNIKLIAPETKTDGN
jgi:hypothetical protein